MNSIPFGSTEGVATRKEGVHRAGHHGVHLTRPPRVPGDVGPPVNLNEIEFNSNSIQFNFIQIDWGGDGGSVLDATRQKERLHRAGHHGVHQQQDPRVPEDVALPPANLNLIEFNSN